MAIILLMSIAGCSSPKETAKQVKSESKERVVATTVAVTEIMDALEVDLVSVPTSSKTLPKRYKGLPEVGNPMSPDMEKVKSLKPSEVLSVTTLEYELKPVFDGWVWKANFFRFNEFEKYAKFY